jgi:hypothetical protein
MEGSAFGRKERADHRRMQDGGESVQHSDQTEKVPILQEPKG